MYIVLFHSINEVKLTRPTGLLHVLEVVYDCSEVHISDPFTYK